MRPSEVFGRKFDFIQFLFEVFLGIIGTFGGVQPQSEPTFPFQYNIIYLKTGKCLAPRSSTLGADRDMRLLSFL